MVERVRESSLFYAVGEHVVFPPLQSADILGCRFYLLFVQLGIDGNVCISKTNSCCGPPVDRKNFGCLTNEKRFKFSLHSLHTLQNSRTTVQQNIGVRGLCTVRGGGGDLGILKFSP